MGRRSGRSRAYVPDDERQPWDIMEGESTLWFARFERYRELGPGRTLQKLWDSYPQPRSRHVSPSWRDACIRFHWVSRTNAWDLYQIMERRRQHELEAQEDKQTRLNLVRVARGKVIQALTLIDPATAKFAEVFAALKIINDEMRNEYDDQPTQRYRLSENEADIAIAEGLAKLAARRQEAIALEDRSGTGYPFLELTAVVRDEEMQE